MYSNLIIYRNELKSKNIQKYKMIGIASEIILSKEIFKKNSEIKKFIFNTFGLSFKSYVYKSRTIIISKVIRIIYSSEDIYKYQKNMYTFISELIEGSEESKNSKNTFDGWI